MKVLDIGSLSVNGSLKDHIPSNASYIGCDLVDGPNVDVILEDPYKLPFDESSIDVITCSSVFEHSDFFWVLYIEFLRVLKPSGLIYLNVPTNGEYHRYPVDCWRFYPDSGRSLEKWGNKNGFNNCLIESFIMKRGCDGWNDFVAVFIKDKNFINKYPNRISQNTTQIINISLFGESEIGNKKLSWSNYSIDYFYNSLKKYIKKYIKKYLKNE